MNGASQAGTQLPEVPVRPESVSDRIWRIAYETCTPLGATVEITLRCNLRCVHCYNFDRALPYPKERAGRELGADEIRSVLDQLAALGCLFVAFTGGEALLHPQLDDFIRHARKRRFAVRVKSNGTLLGRERVARLVDAGAIGVDVSLYGASPATHDAFTLDPGSFERTVQGIENARDAGMLVKVSICLVKDNAHETEAMLRLVGSLGVRAGIDPHVTSRYDGTRDPLDRRLDRETLEAVYRGPLRFLLRPPECNPDLAPQCGCARSVIGIAATGDVYPCIGAPIPAGNVRQAPLARIWETSPEFLRIRSLRPDDFPVCKPCPDRPFCRRSSGAVYVVTGDYTGPEEWTCMEANVLHEIHDEEHAVVGAASAAGDADPAPDGMSLGNRHALG